MHGELALAFKLIQLQTLKRNIKRTVAKPTHAKTRVEIHTDVFHELSFLETLRFLIKAAEITAPIKLGLFELKKNKNNYL